MRPGPGNPSAGIPSGSPPRRLGLRGVLLLVLVAGLVNLPLAHSTWTSARVQASGVDVTAAVTGDRLLRAGEDATYLLELRFPAEVDPERRGWTARVDRATWTEATRTGTVAARVLPSDPAAYRVEGQVSGRLGLVLTLVADLALLGLLVLRLRLGGRRDEELELEAVEDLRRCRAGGAVERLDDGRYRVRGEVLEIGPGDALVLDAAGRRVRVRLVGHHNPAGYQQRVEVLGRSAPRG